MLAGLTRDGLAPRTVGYARAVLRRALNQAVSDGLIPTNPAAGHGLVPKLERREMQVLSGAQVNAILDATRDDPHGALWATLFLTGVRPSEALALKWADVNLDHGQLRVVRKLRRPKNGAAYVRGGREDRSGSPGGAARRAGGGHARAAPRPAGRREGDRRGRAIEDNGLVFADARGNPLRGDGLYKYFWRPLLRRLGLPQVRLYDARHSAATMLLEAGVPMKVVQEVLGHSSMAVTADVYSHVTHAFKRQAADALAAHLGAITE